MTAGVCPVELIRFAERLADLSGAEARRHFRNPSLAMEVKADLSPVTDADRGIELALRKEVAAAQPTHGFFGEEFPAEKPDAEFLWVVDPIDGTKAFLAGKPTFGTLIALLQQGRPILGVIDHPALGERWIGAAGRPTTHNGRTVHSRRCAELGSAVLYASSAEMFKGADRTRFESLRSQVQLNGWGGDCYSYALLASGFIDLVVEAGLGPYDFLALVPVIEGADGRITDWQGGPLGFDMGARNGHVLAAGDPSLHAQAIERLSAQA